MGLSGNNNTKQGLVRVIKPTTNACRKRVDGFYLFSSKNYDYSFLLLILYFDFFGALGIHAPCSRVVSTIVLKHIQRGTGIDTTWDTN